MHHTILVDKREKRWRLGFPDHLVLLSPTTLPTRRQALTCRLSWEFAHLDTGDYLLADAPTAVIIEKKRDLGELVANCLTREGRRKFTDECRRLSTQCRHPVLLIEGTMTHLINAARHLSCDPWLVVDAYQRLCLEHSIETIYMPSNSAAQRRVVGETAARLLINGALTL
jgi:ERCC4-type nuclease